MTTSPDRPLDPDPGTDPGEKVPPIDPEPDGPPGPPWPDSPDEPALAPDSD